jgi:hypothetical protein
VLQLANEPSKTLSAFCDSGRQRAVELAVKKELPVLGIKAHDVGGQHINSEIGREPRNVFAVPRRKASRVMACHEIRTRALRDDSSPPMPGV